MSTNALIIFTRNPELGKVKTRLAKSIGNHKTLQVYKDLLKHTMEQTQYLSCDKFVFYDTKIEGEDIWNTTIYHKKVQANGDLGQRMRASFDFLFGLGYQKCIIIGSDLFDLTENIINKGYAALDAKETVLGPAEDGGYYLLGLKKMNPSLFENKEWGTETVLQDTLRNIDPNNLFLLETLNDIDTLEDLLKTNYVLK